MQVLLIIYGVIGIATVAAQYSLYKANPENTVYSINLGIGLILTFIAYTSFPSNETTLKMLAIIFGVIGIAAIYLKSVSDQPLLPKVLLSFSIIANFVLLFF